ncbi:MAG: hypothetical protein ACF788_09255, partial [Novipirellula sp. JB048]
DAFHIQPDGDILLSFDANKNVSGLGLVRDADILRFRPTAHGALTAGSFEWFFDGSDVGLPPTSGDIDAISFAPDGRLVVSLIGNYLLSDISLSGDDLLVFNNAQFGPDTSGEWALYTDGADVGLAGNDVHGVSIDAASGEIHVTTANEFSDGTITSGDRDILTLLPPADAAGAYTLTPWFSATANRVTDDQSLDGIQVGTWTGTEVFGRAVIYMSSASNLYAGGHYVADEDIVYHDTRTGSWQILFDGSDVGITSDVHAFHLGEDGSMLMSFNTTTEIPSLGSIPAQDIVRFIPRSTGEHTAGDFELYFDGSDVGLTTYYEAIDAIGLDLDRNLLVSLSGPYSVEGIRGTDADLLKFNATSLGSETQGSWQLYLDGSDLAMTSSSEDITGVSSHPITGQLYFTTLGNITAHDFSGTGTDILTCSDVELGADSPCEISRFYSAAPHGFKQSLDAMHVAIPADLTGVDLSVSIAGPAEPVVVGDPVRFTITLTNQGPAIAEDVTLSSLLPSNATLLSASPASTLDSGVLNFALGDLDAATSIQLEILLTTSQPETFALSASVRSSSEDRVSENDTRATTAVVHPLFADLVVTQSDAANPVTVGDSITYQVTLHNRGPQAAHNVVLTDSLPANVQLLSTSLPHSLSDGILTYEFGDLEAGTHRNIEIVVATTTTGSLTNAVHVTSSTADPDTENNTSLETTEVHPPQADLWVTLSDSADPILVGDLLRYNLTVTNRGPQPATRVSLLNTLPSGTQFVSATSNGQHDQGEVEFDLGNLPVGASIEVSLDVIATQTGQLNHQASVTSDTLDLNLTNNHASETTVVDPVHTDLSVTIHGAPETIAVGDELTYLLSITNHGPRTAPGVQLTNLLPASVELVASSDQYSFENDVVSWELGDIDHGATRQVTMTVATSEPGALSDTATVTSDLLDLTESNNTATATSLVLGEAAENDITFVSFSNSGVIAGIPFGDEDILAFNAATQQWSLYFDGSNVGLTSYDINAFHIQPDGSILLSFDTNSRIADLGLVRDSDIVRFNPTHHGVLTAGSFQWFFDGSDVGLNPTSGDVDAISMTPDGRLLISVPGDLNLSGISAANEDLLVLNNHAFGSNTSGDWAIYFDGSDVGLGERNVTGVSLEPSSNVIHLSSEDGFSFGGVSGDAIDIAACTMESLGDQTRCLASASFEGSEHGIPSDLRLDGIQLGSWTGGERFGQHLIYMSPLNGVSIGDLNIADEDIFYHDTRSGAWKLFFDGSDVGIHTDVDAFDLQPDGSLLISFNAPTHLDGIGTVDRPDIVRFVPTTTGHETAGHFEWYFDGSDVGLTSYYEDVDAISMTAEGQLLLSTRGNFDVEGVSGKNADVLLFSPTRLGELTSGDWQLYFDGSDVELTSASENVTGISIDPENPTLYLTTFGRVAAAGFSGRGRDVLSCAVTSFGSDTACDIDRLYDEAASGLSQSLDAVHVVAAVPETGQTGGERQASAADGLPNPLDTPLRFANVLAPQDLRGRDRQVPLSSHATKDSKLVSTDRVFAAWIAKLDPSPAPTQTQVQTQVQTQASLDPSVRKLDEFFSDVAVSNLHVR